MDVKSNMKSEWFSNEFLQNVLRKSENDASIVVTRNSASQVGQKGDNYASAMSRVTLQVTKRGRKETRSLVIKVLPDGEHMAEAILNLGSFPREIKMFSDVLPRIHALLAEAVPGKYSDISAKCYYTENQVPYVIMLEDLSRRGFRLAERSRGLDLNHCLLAMKSIARFHACSHVMHVTEHELFPMFSKTISFEEETSKNTMSAFISAQFRKVISAVEKWNDDYGKELAEKLRDRAETAFEDFIDANKLHPNDFSVLIHGDFSVNNMMFTYDEDSGDVSDVIFVDFQQCATSSFAIDLQQFIHGSVSDEVVENHTDDLLKCYHSEMTRTLTVLGHGQKAPRYEKLVSEYESKSFIGFLWTVIALPLFYTPRGVGVDFENLSKESENAQTESSLSEDCEKALKRRLPLYHNMGLC